MVFGRQLVDCKIQDARRKMETSEPKAGGLVVDVICKYTSVPACLVINHTGLLDLSKPYLDTASDDATYSRFPMLTPTSHMPVNSNSPNLSIPTMAAKPIGSGDHWPYSAISSDRRVRATSRGLIYRLLMMISSYIHTCIHLTAFEVYTQHRFRTTATRIQVCV